MSENVPTKIKHALAEAEQAADKRDDRLERAAQKVEPHLHEARERLAEAERNHTNRVTTSHRAR